MAIEEERKILLIATNITVTYGERAVLRDVSFEIASGEVVALLGANGAGKTSLIKALNRSVATSGGEIVFKNQPLNSLSRREIAQNIAVVAQENETRFPITVLEYVLAGRFANGGAFGWESVADTEHAKRALSDCDLDGYEDRLMNNLSGGERQRVVLARALATNARILLLDEPTANLDLTHQAMMFRLVRERVSGCESAAVVITHDLNLAAEFADKIILLKEGRIVAFGCPEDVLTASNINDVFGVKVLLDQNPASRKVRITAVY